MNSAGVSLERRRLQVSGGEEEPPGSGLSSKQDNREKKKNKEMVEGSGVSGGLTVGSDYKLTVSANSLRRMDAAQELVLNWLSAAESSISKPDVLRLSVRQHVPVTQTH